MKRYVFQILLSLAVTSCGPLTNKEEGGDLEFRLVLQNDASVPLTLQVLFDLCTIEAEKAVATAPARQKFDQTFVGKCETDKDYDDNDEKVYVTFPKHAYIISSGCRETVTCNDEGCAAKLDANCKEQPLEQPPPDEPQQSAH